MWKWYDGIVKEIRDISPSTKQFVVEVPGVEVLDFKAGQFVTMDLPIHEKRLKRWRSYSIANHPSGNNILEFGIVYLENGAGTGYLFNEVKPGTSIRFKGPTGVFTLPTEINEDLVFICTGTGVAPFHSMLWDIYEQQRAHKKIHLIFGTRFESGILYRKAFQYLEEQLSDFKYSVCLSREENWEGEKGYVHKLYTKEYANNYKGKRFYICGWQKMVDEAVLTLKEMGVQKEQIITELYG